MTKEEAQEKLKNTKVYVNGKSGKIQAKLFKLGFRWSSGDKEILHKDKPFLYIEKSLTITFGSDMIDFSVNPNKEISGEEILSIQAEGDLKPFDKVLVRDEEDNIWRVSIFSHIDNEDLRFPYVTINAHWKYCIPYEGNESLLGTVYKSK